MEKLTNATVGEKVKLFRCQIGLAQYQLADLIGKSASFISRIECNQQFLRFKEAEAISSIFGIEPEKLLYSPIEQCNMKTSTKRI